MLHLSNNLKEKKRNINIDLAVLPSHDNKRISRDKTLVEKKIPSQFRSLIVERFRSYGSKERECSQKPSSLMD